MKLYWILWWIGFAIVMVFFHPIFKLILIIALVWISRRRLHMWYIKHFWSTEKIEKYYRKLYGISYEDHRRDRAMEEEWKK